MQVAKLVMIAMLACPVFADFIEVGRLDFVESDRFKGYNTFVAYNATNRYIYFASYGVELGCCSFDATAGDIAPYSFGLSSTLNIDKQIPPEMLLYAYFIGVVIDQQFTVAGVTYERCNPLVSGIMESPLVKDTVPLYVEGAVVTDEPTPALLVFASFGVLVTACRWWRK